MESPGWRRRHEWEVAALVAYLQKAGATTGTGLEAARWEIADDLGWPLCKVDRVVRYARDHSESGVGITIRWATGGVILSTPSAPILGRTLTLASNVTYDWFISDLMRTLRKVEAMFCHYANHPNKQSDEAKLAWKRNKRYRNWLIATQGTLDGDKRPAEKRVDEYIESILSLI